MGTTPDRAVLFIGGMFIGMTFLRGFVSLAADRTTRGAPEGYVRKDTRGVVTAAAGIAATVVAILVTPLLATLMQDLGPEATDAAGIFGSVFALIAVVFAISGFYVKYLYRSDMEDGEKSQYSIALTTVAATAGCIAAVFISM